MSTRERRATSSQSGGYQAHLQVSAGDGKWRLRHSDHGAAVITRSMLRRGLGRPCLGRQPRSRVVRERDDGHHVRRQRGVPRVTIVAVLRSDAFVCRDKPALFFHNLQHFKRVHETMKAAYVTIPNRESIEQTIAAVDKVKQSDGSYDGAYR